MVDKDGTLTLKEAAQELGLSYENALRWVARGRLKTRRAGNLHLVERDDMEEFRTWWEQNPHVQKGRASRTSAR